MVVALVGTGLYYLVPWDRLLQHCCAECRFVLSSHRLSSRHIDCSLGKRRRECGGTRFFLCVR